MSAPRPIILLTGFLGAGKTTLVNRLLGDPAHAQTAVIVNELATTGIDRALIAAVKGQVIEMTTGCLCCSAGGDVGHALLDLARRAEHFEINPFARVIIETTGLADPAPLLPQLMLDARLAEHYRLTSVVTVVDAVAGDSQLDRYGEAEAQVKVADTLLLTKSDLALDPASKRDVAHLCGRLADLNPTAELIDVQMPGVDLVAIFERQPLSRRRSASEWLAAAARPREIGNAATARRRVGRHSQGVEAHTVLLPGAWDEATAVRAVDAMIRSLSPRILRIKGIVATREQPDRPLVLHAVGRYLSAPFRLAAWPEDAASSMLVVIGDGVDKAEIEASLGLAAPLAEAQGVSP
ncbi:MAG: GTP-binding protein [Hyphomicrobiaceae bacterium]